MVVSAFISQLYIGITYCIIPYIGDNGFARFVGVEVVFVGVEVAFVDVEVVFVGVVAAQVGGGGIGNDWD